MSCEKCRSFLSTPSARRATPHLRGLRGRDGISIHALRKEGDSKRGRFCRFHHDFYPRPPQGGRLCLHLPPRFRAVISIHALRKEGDLPRVLVPVTVLRISIHALRKEGDLWSSILIVRWFCISIHALRKEGDYLLVRFAVHRLYFYPRPPQGGRPDRVFFPKGNSNISIHALRKEGDHPVRPPIVQQMAFLSTPSARRATTGEKGEPTHEHYFYPRPPQGGRQWGDIMALSEKNFYPRPPQGGRLQPDLSASSLSWISIHALRKEGDSS